MKRTSRRAASSVGAAVRPHCSCPLVAVAASRGDGDRAATAAAPSFQRDVAPILREKCTGCHQVGGIAPFPLETAKQARELGDRDRRRRRSAKIMPPWPPGPASPDYVGAGDATAERAQQRSTILNWARVAARRPAREPARPPPSSPTCARASACSISRMPTAVPAVGEERHHRRLPLLPPRSEAHGGRATRRRRASCPARASIVHHVILFRIDRERAGGGQAARRRLARRRLVVLRRHRRHAGLGSGLARQRTVDRRLGARLGLGPASPTATACRPAEGQPRS